MRCNGCGTTMSPSPVGTAWERRWVCKLTRNKCRVFVQYARCREEPQARALLWLPSTRCSSRCIAFHQHMPEKEILGDSSFVKKGQYRPGSKSVRQSTVNDVVMAISAIRCCHASSAPTIARRSNKYVKYLPGHVLIISPHTACFTCYPEISLGEPHQSISTAQGSSSNVYLTHFVS